MTVEINELDAEVTFYYDKANSIEDRGDQMEERANYLQMQYETLHNLHVNHVVTSNNEILADRFNIRRLIKQKAVLIIQNQWRKFKLLNSNIINPTLRPTLTWLLLH